MSGEESTVAVYRAFCAYDHEGRAPGCGFEEFGSRGDAREAAETHSKGRCVADFERFSDE